MKLYSEIKKNDSWKSIIFYSQIKNTFLQPRFFFFLRKKSILIFNHPDIFLRNFPKLKEEQTPKKTAQFV